MNKFKELYTKIMEEVETPFEKQVFIGVLIDPDKQSIEPFEFTGQEIKDIRSNMSEPQEDELGCISGAVLLSDINYDLLSTDFAYSVYDEPNDLVRGSIGYIIPATDSDVEITVDQIKPIVRFGTPEELGVLREEV